MKSKYILAVFWRRMVIKRMVESGPLTFVVPFDFDTVLVNYQKCNKMLKGKVIYFRLAFYILLSEPFAVV